MKSLTQNTQVYQALVQTRDKYNLNTKGYKLVTLMIKANKLERKLLLDEREYKHHEGKMADRTRRIEGKRRDTRDMIDIINRQIDYLKR